MAVYTAFAPDYNGLLTAAL